MSWWFRTAFGFLLLVFFLSFSLNVVSATTGSTLLPLGNVNNSTQYPGIGVETIQEWMGGGTGAQGVVNVVRSLFDLLKKLLGPVMIFFIGGFGIQLIIARGNEETFSAAGRHFLYLLAGLAFVIFADFLSQTFSLYQVESGEAVTFISDNGQIIATTSKIGAQIDTLIRFLRYVLGGIAVFYVVKSGAAIMFSADEETVGKQRDAFMYGFIGFILIIGSEALVRTIFDVQPVTGFSPTLGSVFVGSGINVSGGLSLLGNITNLFLAALSSLFLFSLVAGGVMYSLSAGNEERGQAASKIIIGSLMGLVIAFSSYTLVAEFSSGGRAVREAQEGVVPLQLQPGTPLPTTRSP